MLDINKLRLILGVGRSGTSWLIKIFAQITENLRCFNEPLYRVLPSLNFSKKDDHLAIGYTSELDYNHPLVSIYSLFLTPVYNWNSLGIVTKRNIRGGLINSTRVLKNPKIWNQCLIKEVHCLLATEGILKYFKAPTVLVIRDPVYIIDSIFDVCKLNSIYLKIEYIKMLSDTIFLTQFLNDLQIETLKTITSKLKKDRQSIIIKKMITVWLIQNMFKILSIKYPDIICIAQYEETCKNPQESFKKIAKFFGFKWTSLGDHLLEKCTTTQSKGKFSVHKISSKQLNRPFKFLTSSEVNFCRQIEQQLKG